MRGDSDELPKHLRSLEIRYSAIGKLAQGQPSYPQLWALMNLNLFQIGVGSSLRDALDLINQNQHGLVFVRSAHGSVVGVATDGDIRRGLLKGSSLSEPIDGVFTRNFVWADDSTTREALLKQLDTRVKVIPILDGERRLKDIVTRDRLPVTLEGSVFSRARAPVRISFGGGGSDLTHFFIDRIGAVVNATISLYSHALLKIRSDEVVKLKSADLDATLEANNLQEALKVPGHFGLVQAILKTIQPDFGFELYLRSDFPMNSGLGGSAVVTAAVLGCFNQFRKDRWTGHEMAELAFQSERIYLGVEGGWQDQYATIFGGVNFIEFSKAQNLVYPIRINPDILFELEESLVLCDTGTTHNSGNIHRDQRVQMSEESVRKLVEANVELTYRIRDFLLRGSLVDFGKSLNDGWQLKRQFSRLITNHRLDDLYSKALCNGAIGGKLLGAGGGGFFLFYASPFKRHELIDYLTHEGLSVRPFRFDGEGLRSWSVRESVLV